MDKTKQRYLYIISFFSGLSIMAVEISAARLLAPYFGTSLFVWTNVIGVVMVALSIGYYVGGKLADKQPHLKVLLKLLVGAGVFTFIIPWIIKPLAGFVSINAFSFSGGSLMIFLSSLIVALGVFAFPLILMGMVSPFVIKLFSLSDRPMGEVAGSVFAISTIGSILGTFLPTLWLIPTIGTRATVIIFSVVLIALGAVGLFQRKLLLIGVLAFLLPLPIITQASIKSGADVIAETESAYQYIQVQQVDPKTRYLKVNDGMGIQSTYFEDKYLSGWMYFDYVNLLPYFIEKEEKKAMIIGLAGGTITRMWHHFFPGEIKTDGVEIDGKIIELAKEYFELENPDLTIHNADGRMFVKHADGTYDIIVVDAYSQQFYIPWTLTTQEFWKDVRGKLSDEGLVAMNVNAAYRDSPLLVALSNTVASVFEHTYISKTFEGEGWNYLLVGSVNRLPFATLESKITSPELRPLAEFIARNTESIDYDGREKILTDDWAPVEFMTDSMVYSYLLENLNN